MSALFFLCVKLRRFAKPEPSRGFKFRLRPEGSIYTSETSWVLTSS